MKIKHKKQKNPPEITILINTLKPLNIKQKNVNTPKNKISLDDKFKKYKGKNQAKEFSWDNPMGKEIL